MKIYIPHWLDSMTVLPSSVGWKSLIYIPHWLDSMLLSRLSRLRYVHLHSTLVRFYGSGIHGIKQDTFIYIPHWLDSMVGSNPTLSANNKFTFHTG